MTSGRRIIVAFVLTLVASSAWGDVVNPIGLHPINSHYFWFRGKPTVLITSGEHYGAVLNLDLDYGRYLDELRARGFNLTRTFAGSYREVPGTFGITENTLAPKPGRFLCPWARSGTPGALDGANKFDLSKWNPDFFQRLHEFVEQAGKRGIVVELSFFCPIYDDRLWDACPMKAVNNVAGHGKGSRLDVFTLKEQALTAVQENLIRKIVTELREFDNVYFEVCNEPYFGGVTREWSERMIATVVDAEKGLASRHLIAQNIANGSARVEMPNPAVSIFNFHYATPPDAVTVNYKLGRPVGDDETGFRGTKDSAYRAEAWEFMLAGGAIFSHLDYSFTCSHPDGTAAISTSPGGGGANLRHQLQILKEFVEGFDFVRMKPMNATVKGAAAVRVLAEPGQAYAVYVRGGTQAEVRMEMPAGDYRAEWVNVRTGKVEKTITFGHGGGRRSIDSPVFSEDSGLRVRRIEFK